METRVRTGVVVDVDRFTDDFSVVFLRELDQEEVSQFAFYGRAPLGVRGKSVDLVEYRLEDSGDTRRQELRTSDSVFSTPVRSIEEMESLKEGYIEQALMRVLRSGRKANRHLSI